MGNYTFYTISNAFGNAFTRTDKKAFQTKVKCSKSHESLYKNSGFSNTAKLEE